MLNLSDKIRERTMFFYYAATINISAMKSMAIRNTNHSRMMLSMIDFIKVNIKEIKNYLNRHAQPARSHWKSVICRYGKN